MLGHPSTTKDTLGRALHAYDVVRRPFAQSVAAGSWENGLLMTFNHPEFPLTGHESEEEKNAILDRTVQRIAVNMEWASKTRIEDDVQCALDILQS